MGYPPLGLALLLEELALQLEGLTVLPEGVALLEALGVLTLLSNESALQLEGFVEDPGQSYEEYGTLSKTSLFCGLSGTNLLHGQSQEKRSKEGFHK
ncbi:hypothetical protein MRB53_016378 [Persea americana]|uniref:Uncharacterized protein n=1 Tax=Persea americana TaxID=3435 RepID=A0ACC2M1V8_PERAE|nr:hypothetical protein MRB53_016378 [Persea americana]